MGRGNPLHPHLHTCGSDYTLRPTWFQGNQRMFENLIQFDPEVEDTSSADFARLSKTEPVEHLDAQIETADWLKALGAAGDEVANELEAQAARNAFSKYVTAQPAEEQHAALAEIKTPAAVQHLVGMLTAYDWEFVNQAKELRGYTVAKILEETNHPTASVRLKALALLGKVTEVGLFTEKIEVKKTELSDTELESRIREKLNKLAKIVDITDISDAHIKELDQIECQTIDTQGESGESSIAP